MGRGADAVHAERVLKVISGSDAASSALAASWRRSGRLHALDPASRTLPQRLAAAEITEAKDKLGPMLRVAQPSLERLFFAVGGVGCSVMLADRERGDPRAARRGRRRSDLRRLRPVDRRRVEPGNFEGTNGIGACLIDRGTLTIDRDQHFFARNLALLGCTTAPIFDEHGELAAALDVSSCRARRLRWFRSARGHRGCGCGAGDRSGELPPGVPELAYHAAAGQRAGGDRVDRRRQGRSCGWRDAGGADRAGINAETLARPMPAGDLIGRGKGDDDPSRQPNGRFCSARLRVPAATYRKRPRTSTCPARPSTARLTSSA